MSSIRFSLVFVFTLLWISLSAQDPTRKPNGLPSNGKQGPGAGGGGMGVPLLRKVLHSRWKRTEKTAWEG